jgi:5-methylcytosine-specific restriction endonuclease McrA
MTVLKKSKLKQPRTEQVVPITMQKKKERIPAALREQVWLKEMGKVFEGKCSTTWCTNKITVFDFESGHNVPESKGGKTILENLIPICSRCNKSMSNTHTFDEWCKKYTEPPKKPLSLREKILLMFVCH